MPHVDLIKAQKEDAWSLHFSFVFKFGPVKSPFNPCCRDES